MINTERLWIFIASLACPNIVDDSFSTTISDDSYSKLTRPSRMSSENDDQFDEVDAKSTSINECPRFCEVCGDAATGYHYNIASCNGCKTFFRRTVVHGRRYKCKDGKKCDLSKERRRLCRGCRFEKCVRVGMDPRLIQFPEGVDVRKLIKHSELPKRWIDSPSKISVRTLKFKDEGYRRVLDNLLYTEMKYDFLRSSTYYPDYRILSLESVINSPCILSRSGEYEPITEWKVKQPIPLEEHGSPKRQPLLGRFWLLVDLVLNIECAKTFPCFQLLSLPDKMALMKEVAVIHLVMVQCFSSYEKRSDTVMYPDGIFPILFTKRPTTLETEMYNKGIEPLIRYQPDKNEYVLLKAIAMAHYPCERLSSEGRKLLQKEREKYASILLNYVNAKHGIAKGPAKFASLLAALDTFLKITSRHRQFYFLLVGRNVILKEPHPAGYFIEEILG